MFGNKLLKRFYSCGEPGCQARLGLTDKRRGDMRSRIYIGTHNHHLSSSDALEPVPEEEDVGDNRQNPERNEEIENQREEEMMETEMSQEKTVEDERQEASETEAAASNVSPEERTEEEREAEIEDNPDLETEDVEDHWESEIEDSSEFFKPKQMSTPYDTKCIEESSSQEEDAEENESRTRHEDSVSVTERTAVTLQNKVSMLDFYYASCMSILEVDLSFCLSEDFTAK